VTLAQAEQIIKILKQALDEHEEYAHQCREDWSDYDGRSHRNMAVGINSEANARILAILESKAEEVEK
jgi:hypothetical protein